MASLFQSSDNLTAAFTATPSITSITFPAAGGTGTPTSDTLGFYETGTFVPVLQFGGASTGITYATQIGKYVRVGNQVSFNIRILLTSKGSSTGIVSFTGLPFTAASDNDVYEFFSVFTAVTTPTDEFYTSTLGTGATLITSYYVDTSAGTRTALDDSMFTNNATVNIQGFYFLA